ncbi:MAG TPA: Fe-S cluster assembly protein SufD [Pyrinomonadaceae bacterium]|nr:Fe-S cluster assembly protein SufD [Pyrinomonadaceae bacterium]
MVTEIATKQNSYRAAFDAWHARVHDHGPSWLRQLRENAFGRFEELGFPSVKDEEWKYTNVAAIASADFLPDVSMEVPVSGVDARLARFGSPETAASQLIFVNGKLRKDLSSVASLPSEVVAIELSQAIADERHAEIVRSNLARHADYVANGFTALNTGFISEGAFIHIPRGVTVDQPIQVAFINEGDFRAASFPRVLVVAEENSSAMLVESYSSTGDSAYFTNAVIEIVLKEGARLEHYKVQRESQSAFHIATTQADLGPNSSYDSTTITFGAQLSRHDYGVTMDHEGVECWVDGLYLITAGQHTDTHSSIDHRKPHCTSHQLYKGILDGKSRAVFNGKVFVRHDAQKTDAMQTNKNLLLSNEARVDTKPQLEILADDVKCAHGAAVGQIDEDELFYLATRGIHPDLARNLLTYGFAEEVIGKIKVESIRAELDEAVLNRLNAKLEA